MTLSKTAAAALIFAKLDAAQDYGAAGPTQIAQARAQLHVIADAFSLCITHLVSNGVVSTTDTVAVSGAVASPPTAGTVTGTGSGSVSGLVKGSALGGTGLAGAIQAALDAGQSYPPGADLVGARQLLAVLADACAEFATYVMANAVPVTTVTGASSAPPGANGPSSGRGTGTIS